jgi:hypothetical protein
MFSSSEDIWAGVFLILSNIGIVPAISLAITYDLIPEAAIYSVVCFISTVYHICQADFYCVYSFRALQTSDHFFVFGLLIWTTLYFIGLDLTTKFTVFIIIQGLLLPAVIDFLESWWIGGVLLAFLLIFSLFVLSKFTKKIHKPSLVDFMTATVLIGGGFFFHLYAGEPGANRYWWAHSIWHLLGMLSLYFIIQMKSGKGVLHNFMEKYRGMINGNKVQIKEIDLEK